MLFSRRMGLKPAIKPLQIDSIDDELRNSLWSVFHELVLKSFKAAPPQYYSTEEQLAGSNLQILFFTYWFEFFHAPTDTIPFRIGPATQIVRERFFAASYGEVYDFFELTLLHVPEVVGADLLQRTLNGVLTKHNAAYRFVSGTAARITSDTEIETLEKALETPLPVVKTHLRSALEKLTDRKAPDFRNSVKESISAIEALAQSITGEDHATMPDALRVLAPAIGMHVAFRDALSKLYGYTSDAEGIRHALLEEPTLTYTDALFMLVACSAFVNYIVGKAADGKVSLRKV